MQLIFSKKAQSVLEYALILAIVSAACLTMVLYVRRASEGPLADIAAQVTIKAENARH